MLSAVDSVYIGGCVSDHMCGLCVSTESSVGSTLLVPIPSNAMPSCVVVRWGVGRDGGMSPSSNLPLNG